MVPASNVDNFGNLICTFLYALFTESVKIIVLSDSHLRVTVAFPAANATHSLLEELHFEPLTVLTVKF